MACAHLYSLKLINQCSLHLYALNRGENGELRVGVRRAMRQQANISSSVISSHNMHLGVLATAWHAVNTGSMFTVYYKPRFVLVVGIGILCHCLV